MNIRDKRISNDIENLQNFLKNYNFIVLRKISGKPVESIKLDLTQSLPVNQKDWEEKFKITIKFPSRYPLAPPSFSIHPVILHPNVFMNGEICMGIWKMTNQLHLEVERLLKILFFYEEYVNTSSPANSSALSFYKKNKQNFPIKKI